MGRWAERHRSRIPWKRLRLWVPFSALIVTAVIAAFAVFADSEAVMLLEFLNAPAILPLVPALYLGLNLGAPYALALWIAALWAGWYGCVRALEWRAWRSTPLSLDIGENKKRPAEE